MADESLPELVKLVETCLRLDPSLTLRDFESSDKSSVSSLVFKWQVAATRAALERRDLDERHGALSGATRAADNPPPTAKRSNPFSQLVANEDNLKRQKVQHRAGVLTGDGDENISDFGVRLGGPTPVRPSQLNSYPGRSTVLLNFQELMGPSILHSFCQEGPNIELVVRNVRRFRQFDGGPFSSKVEALTLDRCLHFHLCTLRTMEEAILSAPWTEIALRRLWSLLEVEHLTSGPSPLTREEALHQVLPSLEVYPDIGVRVPATRSIVNCHI